MNYHLEIESSRLAEESASGDDENEHEDFDVLEYARFYGLCKDSAKTNALKSIKLFLPPVDTFRDLDDPFCSPSVKVLEEPGLKERINIDRDAAVHLRWITSLQEPPPRNEPFQLERGNKLRLKFERPLLRTDHELDMRGFSLPQSYNILSKHCIEPEQVDDEADQSFAWPSSHNDVPVRQDVELETEKISVTRDVLLHLQSNIKDAFTDEDEESIVVSAFPDRRSKRLTEHLTPPLLPLSPTQEPCIPSSPVGHFELASQSTDSTAAEAQVLEQRLFKGDRIVPHGVPLDLDPMLLDDYDVVQVYSPVRSIADTPSSPPPKRRRRDDLKVEGPLTPPTNFESPGKRAKTVSFKECLEEYIAEIPSTYMQKEELSLSSEAEVEKFFDDVIRPFAEEADRNTQQEQLRDDSNVQRVDVPILDFTMPEPPWMEFARKANKRTEEHESDLGSQKRLLSMIKHENLRNEKAWPGVSKIERQLSWIPFPAQLAKITNEQIQDDDTLARTVDEFTVSDIIDSASLTWKPEGLRILDESDEEDDELEEAVFLDDQQDMSSLLKKRRLEMDGQTQPPKRTSFGPVTSEGPERLSQVHVKKSQHQAVLEKANESQWPHDSGLMFGGMFSATTALHNYMNLHGAAAKTSAVDTDGTKKLPMAQKPAALLALKASEPIMQTAHLRDQTPQSITLPLPKISVPTTSTPFIINSQVLLQRQLFRRLEQLFPSANFIERDLTLRAPNSRSGDAADIILSPSTGLIWTTVQKLRQRPLPGQIARNGVKDRIQAIAGRYERLIVLVSEGAVATSSMPKFAGLGISPHDPATETSMFSASLDERDCLAFADVAALAASLEDEVVVSYVPGGEETLAHWIVSLMAKFAVPGKLVEVETVWERFLRRAGLNAYAAQAVLAELKNLDDGVMVDEREGGSYGLPAFVRMGREERTRRFEVLLGGRKVLERVGKVFDSKWVSAMRGKIG